MPSISPINKHYKESIIETLGATLIDCICNFRLQEQKQEDEMEYVVYPVYLPHVR